MEFEKVIGAAAIVIVMILAYFTMITDWNVAYTETVGGSENATYSRVQALGESGLFNLSEDMGNATIPGSGAGTGSTTSDLIQRGLRAIVNLPLLLGLIPAMFKDMALIVGIPEAYVNVAVYVFITGFALLFAYLLVIGVRRLL